MFLVAVFYCTLADTFYYSYHLSVEQCIDITRRIYMPIISELKG